MLWILNETYFNQNKLKFCKMLSQTYIWNISAHSDHGHLCWASRKTSFQCLYLHLAVINIVRLWKKCLGLLYLLKFRSTVLIWQKSLDNLVLFVISACFICISDKRKCTTMQHGNSSFFSQNDFPPRSQMRLPLRACATVTSTRFLHAGAMENATY